MKKQRHRQIKPQGLVGLGALAEPPVFLAFFISAFFQVGSFYVAQPGLKFVILLELPVVVCTTLTAWPSF
jgi:hypothetical protein